MRDGIPVFPVDDLDGSTADPFLKKADAGRRRCGQNKTRGLSAIETLHRIKKGRQMPGGFSSAASRQHRY